MIVFTSDLFGTSNHLSYNSGFAWVDNIPDDAWVYSNFPHKYSVEEWLAMYNIDTEQAVEAKYLKMANVLGINNPPWQLLLGKKFTQNFKQISTSMEAKINASQNSEYEPIWRKIQDFIFSLKPVKVDIVRYNSLRKRNIDLPGFNITTGSLNSVQYDRRTKTGRLRVSSGPSVLTLKSEYRNVVKNCRQIDFKNMEPRLLLALVGKRVQGDLYENIAKDLKLNADRTYVKISVISSLYGSKVLPEISDYFGLPAWISELEANVEDGWIKNYFGRPINCNDIKGHHLLSLWLQSSAADAALLGFAKFFAEQKNLKPHWIIHDACIFSGEGDIPEYLSITDEIQLPVECTEI